MNSTMKWSMAAAVAILLGIIGAVVITSKPVDNTATNQEVELGENQVTEDTVEPIESEVLSGFEPIAEPVSELQIIDLVEGDGEAVAEGATVTAHYTGAYAVNGEIFESSKTNGNPFTSELGGLILGWQEGIPGMKVGGTRRLIIPGELAYGEAPDGYVPGSSGRPLGTLVFDIEMIEVQ